MSTAYKLTDGLEVIERSSRFLLRMRLPLESEALDHEWASLDCITGEELLSVAAEAIKVASYSVGPGSREVGKKMLQDTLRFYL